MHGAIVEWDGIGQVVIEFEQGCAACEQEGDYVSKTFGYSSQAHIVQELIFDRVRESILYVQEEHGHNLAAPPGILNLVDRQDYSVGSISPWPPPELGCKE